MALLSGQDPGARIVPFRGEYYALKPDAWPLCRNLIYPTPDPKFPFLGVHFTRMIDGSVECGPNAVLAFGREAYSFFRLNPRDLFETLTYRGFLRMAASHWRTGLGEMWRSLPSWAGHLITLVIGLMTTAAVALLTPWKAVTATVALLVGWLAFNGIVLFDYLNLSAPTNAVDAKLPKFAWQSAHWGLALVKGIERR